MSDKLVYTEGRLKWCSLVTQWEAIIEADVDCEVVVYGGSESEVVALRQKILDALNEKPCFVDEPHIIQDRVSDLEDEVANLRFDLETLSELVQFKPLI